MNPVSGRRESPADCDFATGTVRMREVLAMLQLAATNAERKHLPLAAAGLAYNVLLSLIPVLMVLTAVGVYLPLKHGMQDVNSFLVNVVPPQASPFIKDLLTKIS